MLAKLPNASLESVYLLPFSIDGAIYVLQDERREIIGTGQREVCAALFTIMRANADYVDQTPERSRSNVRSAMVM